MFSSILSKSYHYSTDFSSIFSISFHYSTYFSSVYFISFPYFLPYFQYHFTIDFRIFNICSLFNRGFFRILMSHRSAVTFDTFCLIIFISCVLSFRLSPRFVCLFLFMFSLLFSVSNFYFTSQYHQRFLFHSSLSNLYNNVLKTILSTDVAVVP